MLKVYQVCQHQSWGSICICGSKANSMSLQRSVRLNDKDAKSLFNEIRKGLKLQALSEKIKVQKEIIPEKGHYENNEHSKIFLKREE